VTSSCRSFVHVLNFYTFDVSFPQFCFKESYDDNPDLNTTLYLCRVIMSFLCLLYAPPFNPRPAPSAAATRLTFVRCSYLKRAFKTSTDLFAIIKQSSATKENLRRRGLFRIGSSIGIACLVDCCAELFMESFCLLINLWMVFGANKPIDMVLNSLALEFIKDIGAPRDMCSAPLLPFPSPHTRIRQRVLPVLHVSRSPSAAATATHLIYVVPCNARCCRHTTRVDLPFLF
jgi:hypothetical protein